MDNSPGNNFIAELVKEIKASPGTADIRKYPSKTRVFQAGDPGDGFFVVESGCVEIFGVGPHDAVIKLATIEAGDFFGEMALIDDAPRSATAETEGETHLLFIGRDAFMQLLERRPHLSVSLLRTFSTRMRGLNKKYLDDIVQAERLATVGRFARGVVHDFKQPLTAISLAAEMGCRDKTSPTMRQSMKDSILRGIDQMSNMLQDLIEFTRSDDSKLDTVQIPFHSFMKPLASDMELQMSSSKVKLVVEPAPEGLETKLDPRRLPRVFYNLMHNAADEMPQGGTITVSFKVENEELVIRISDTGKGIAPEIAARLFQPFATHGKAHGTGLGLSICKRIVDDHGGRIFAQNNPDKGATFGFTLPIAATESEG
jgi:signal transduction histidine kinase